MESYARQNQSRKNQNISISPNPIYDSGSHDPVKTRLAGSEAEVEESTNRMARNQAL